MQKDKKIALIPLIQLSAEEKDITTRNLMASKSHGH